MKLFQLFLIFFLSYLSSGWSQDVAIRKSFFDTENFRLAAAIGYDISWAGDNGKTGLISNNGSLEKENFYFAPTTNSTISLMFDGYSPTSTLGFMTGLGINSQEYSIVANNNIMRDSLKITNLEIPVYARLRIGKVLSRSQMWIALGGGYSFTTKAEMTSNTSVSDVKNQFSSIPFLSGIIGYELSLGNDKTDAYNRDAFRVLLFGKVNYDLDNRLNTTNLETNTALNTFDDPSIEFLRISVGIKVLMRLGKAGELLGEAFQNQLNSN